VRRAFSMKLVVIPCVLAAILGVTLSAHAAVSRDVTDQEEVDRMKARAPHALELLEQGEALVQHGELARAESVFAQGHREYVDGALLFRRDCQVLVALGRRDEAIHACMLALEGSHSNANFRAAVRALVDGSSPPTPTELSQALMIVARERDRTANGSPVPLGATCDIAESIGDGVMLEHCAQDLMEHAPAAADTQRALEVLSSRCPPWRFWTGWLALFALLALTVGHALRRTRWRAPATPGIGLVIGLLFSLLPRTAAADPDNAEPGFLSQWRVDDKAPETKIPTEKERNASPLEFGYWLQDVALKGEMSSRHGDHAAAARYYKALAIAVPDRAIGYTKACAEYEAMGDLTQAIAECGAALQADGLVVKDYLNYVRLVLEKPGPIAQDDLKTLDDVIIHMREDPAGRGAADSVECSIATRTLNVAELAECTTALARTAPNDPQTISYQWALAMERHQYGEARALIARGQSLGLADPNVASMQKATDEGLAGQRKRIWLGVLAVALLLGGAVVVVGAVMRRRVVAPGPA
jgi:tetratricopeptide (TPR) repeat protein